MPERAILVGVDLRGRSATRGGSVSFSAEESLQELTELAQSAGATVVERVLQSRPVAEAATLIGSGKVRELADLARSREADVVLFDHDLTPTQQRNLEKALSAKVIDRTQLILDIFAGRARTREGRLQVELAQLSYLLPRLTGRGIEMSRLGGGIGTRGPGETQLESDRRRIARRIKKIKEDLDSVRAGRAIHRKQRHSVPLATLALVGYTNAGKSSLFNRLTEAAVPADARMFATLDPTVRSVTLPSRRRVLLSDTVGFIRNLPTTLVKAFRATLEEVAESTLILHVVDVSSPHAPSHTEQVLKVLADIEASSIPQLLVLNKIDLLPEPAGDAETMGRRLIGQRDEAKAPIRAVPISALTGHGLDKLLAAIDEILPFDPIVRAVFRFPAGEGAGISLVHELGRVIETRYTGAFREIEADVPESLKLRLSRFLDAGE
ncbi:MAG: GTPase HflX [Acidobacteria bacterium]|nr:GTPase HflX [Acidobacteriota bacterium]